MGDGVGVVFFRGVVGSQWLLREVSPLDEALESKAARITEDRWLLLKLESYGAVSVDVAHVVMLGL